MLFPEILLNKESIVFKFKKMVGVIKEAFKKSNDKKIFLSEEDWSSILNSSSEYKSIIKKRCNNIKSDFVVCMKLYEIENVFTWAFTKKVYDYSNSLFEELFYQGSSSDDIPIKTLFGIPDWCAWFNVPNTIESGSIKGFFIRTIRLNHRVAKKTVYSIILTVYIKMKNHAMPQPVSWGFVLEDNVTLKDLIEAVLVDDSFLPLTKNLKETFNANDDQGAFIDKFTRIIKGLLNVVLFVCQEEVDLENYTKKSQVESSGIGYDKAANIPFINKTVNIREISDVTQDMASSGIKRNGSEKCPHVRSGFYRVYWTGPGRTIPRVRWVNSVFVNSDKIISE